MSQTHLNYHKFVTRWLDIRQAKEAQLHLIVREIVKYVNKTFLSCSNCALWTLNVIDDIASLLIVYIYIISRENKITKLSLFSFQVDTPAACVITV